MEGVFLNSIPKSGTHLLHQILINLNFGEKFGFFASTPSWNMRIRRTRDAKKYLSKIYKNEIISGHLFYSEEMENFLKEHSFPTIFIYRDPRAIFLSELHYLSEMNRWHRCHKFYSKCNSFDEKFDLCLEGLPMENFYYPKFSERISDYIGWINCDHALCIQFEELINEKTRDKAVKNIIDYLSFFNKDIKGLNFHPSNSLINPENSHTFTGMDPHRWQKTLNTSQILRLESQLGDLINEMGYK